MLGSSVDDGGGQNRIFYAHHCYSYRHNDMHSYPRAFPYTLPPPFPHLPASPRIPTSPHPPLFLVQWLMANKRTSTVLEEEERAKAQRDLKALIEQTLGDVGYEAESL